MDLTEVRDPLEVLKQGEIIKCIIIGGGNHRFYTQGNACGELIGSK